jgi:polyhydroxyalkanoate synthesis regulator phasin
MPTDLGGSQISSLLDALPGIASVLRSPVADALIKAMRASAGLAELTPEDVEELIRYAVRRGLIGADEGDRVLVEVQEALRAGGGPPRRKTAPKKPKAKKKPKR